jgi:RNA polymerase sigma-70 factor (ECF subfamily)
MATAIMMNQNAGDHWDWPAIRTRCKAEAMRFVRRHHDAEEVVQEALARAWRSSGTCRTPEAPMPWCLQITRNEALRLLGRRGAPGSAHAVELEGELEDQRARREVDRAMLRVDLDRALQTLTPDERLLIALRYEYDCSHPEIAAKLRIPEATARVRLHRARKRLKPLL